MNAATPTIKGTRVNATFFSRKSASSVGRNPSSTIRTSQFFGANTNIFPKFNIDSWQQIANLIDSNNYLSAGDILLPLLQYHQRDATKYSNRRQYQAQRQGLAVEYDANHGRNPGRSLGSFKHRQCRLPNSGITRILSNHRPCQVWLLQVSELQLARLMKQA